jgi:hypothetical protein
MGRARRNRNQTEFTKSVEIHISSFPEINISIQYNTIKVSAPRAVKFGQTPAFLIAPFLVQPSLKRGPKLKHDWPKNEARGLIMKSDIHTLMTLGFLFAEGAPRNSLSLNDK